ncbi:MAG: hypothetical protein LC754_03760, partial [Acidobacteria bacterium]|nr:hypothetical protein [Acidobacteriota bacterium]
MAAKPARRELDLSRLADHLARRGLHLREIAGGTPNPAIIPMPGLGEPLMPTTTFKGYPFYVAADAGHRAPQPPLSLENDGGLQRHKIVSGVVVDGKGAVPANMLNDVIASRVSTRNTDPNLFGFARKLTSANITLLAPAGTTAELNAMKFHSGLLPPTGTTATSVTTIYGWPAKAYATYKPDGTAGTFLVNGQAADNGGAPYAEPCAPTFKDGNGTVRTTPKRTYRTAWIQTVLTINNAGWHDRQGRIAVLEQDVAPTLGGTRAAEPLFFRANSGDCIDYRVTNLIPNNLNLDDFQVFQATDIIGQHIHLVKFDVTSSDGAGNGWNYESGALSPDEVRERIEANNTYRKSLNPTAPTQILAAKTNATFGSGTNGAFVGAQTLIERWWADPLVNTSGKDRTIRTVFTHDHFSPSGHQHHGLYAGLVIEPTDSKWQFIDGTAMGGPVPTLRADGGPTSFAANIIAGLNSADSYREFNLALGDFAIVYTPELLPVNPPNRIEQPLPIVVGFPGGDDTSVAPLPEAISSADPGTSVMNYRNEPAPLRLGQKDATTGHFTLKTTNAGNLANIFSTDVHGDPFTPILKGYPGDHVQLRWIQGAQEEQHVLTVHGQRWKFEPGTVGFANNSGYNNAQQIGISEHFEFDVTDAVDPVFGASGMADFLYRSSAVDNIWDGMWGVFRTYGAIQPDVARLPNNPHLPGTLTNPFGAGNCPVYTGAPPIRSFTIQAWLARDLAGANGVVYNHKFGFTDPGAIVFINANDYSAYTTGGKPLEPLVIRINSGDCAQITLENHLPTAAVAGLSDYDSFNMLPPIVPQFNFNQVNESRRVSLHPQVLTYEIT